MNADRMRQPLLAIIRAALRPVDFYASYRARVVTQAGNKVDLQPDDSRLPGMSGVALRHGLPGVSLTVSPGAYVLVGWDGGDPQKPYAYLWEGGETPITVTIKAATLNLGDTGGEPAAKATTLLTWLSAHTHPTPAGASSPSALPTTGIAATNTMVK